MDGVSKHCTYGSQTTEGSVPLPSEALLDIVRQDDALLGRYELRFMLSPSLLSSGGSTLPPLTWDSVPYGPDQASSIPNDKRGLYAFVIVAPGESLPPHGYVCYIGIAGRRSNRSLRERYRDYLSDKKNARRRRIAHLIAKWHEVLRFFYAPVDDSVTSDELQEMERHLHDTFMPEFSSGDFSATIRETRKAFRS